MWEFPEFNPVLCDAHLHLYDLTQRDPHLWESSLLKTRPMMVSHYSQEELDFYLEKRREGFPFLLSLGVHPQLPEDRYLEVLERALEQEHLHAVGEMGFDFFTPEYAATELQQERLFVLQAQLALNYGLPVVIHIRKAVDRLFSHLTLLKKLPGVVFHSWPSPLREAKALLAKGVNAYFSFGNPLRQGNKKALESLAGLPRDRILMETDAPWQVLKGQSYTPLDALEENYRTAAQILGLRDTDLEIQVEENFKAVYGTLFY